MAEQNAHATNLELAKNAGSRYLVQRWGDGTLCDKTGKNREVEVQVRGTLFALSSCIFKGVMRSNRVSFSSVPLFNDYDR